MCTKVGQLFWKYGVSKLYSRWCSFRSRHERGTAQAFIRFFGSEGDKPADIHQRRKRQDEDMCVTSTGM